MTSHLTAITDFAANDPVAAAIVGGVFLIISVAMNGFVTIATALLTSFLDRRHHEPHEAVSFETNADVGSIKKILQNGTYIPDEKSGGKIWQKSTKE